MTRNRNKKQLLSLVLLLLFCFVNFGCATTPHDPYAGRAVLHIDSFPQGAKIYQNGEYIGTTPYGKDTDWGWSLNYRLRTAGVINSPEIVFVRDGYLPLRKKYELELAPTGKRRYLFHDLLILERDPSAPRYVQSPSSRHHYTIKQEESGLDQLLKAGQIGLILQSLKPVR